MLVRPLVLLAVLAWTPAAAAAVPKPLHGVPLTGPTGLRLLVANDPPFVLDVDTGLVTPVTGLDVRGNPGLGVRAVGKDAVVWVHRRAPAAKVPRADIYVVRHGRTVATRIATGWDVAPAADGRAVWLKSFTDARQCTLGEVGLDGRPRRSPRPVPCSTQLVDTGAGAALVQGSSVVDPLTSWTLLRTGGVWAIAGRFALTSAEHPFTHPVLALADLRDGTRRRLPWPSRIGGTDQAAVQPNGKLIRRLRGPGLPGRRHAGHGRLVARPGHGPLSARPRHARGGRAQVHEHGVDERRPACDPCSERRPRRRRNLAPRGAAARSPQLLASRAEQRQRRLRSLDVALTLGGYGHPRR
jgi:hypothetical protein